MSPRWRLIAKALSSFLILAGCQGTTTVVNQSVRTVVDVSEAQALPDGSEVTVAGWIASPSDGSKELRVVDRLFDGTSDDLGPLYDVWLVLQGVDTETLDFFMYPGGSSLWADSLWADHYNVTGTMQNGELHAESLELLLVNPDRQRVADCNAFLAGAVDELGECPPRWVEPHE